MWFISKQTCKNIGMDISLKNNFNCFPSQNYVSCDASKICVIIDWNDSVPDSIFTLKCLLKASSIPQAQNIKNKNSWHTQTTLVPLGWQIINKRTCDSLKSTWKYSLPVTHTRHLKEHDETFTLISVPGSLFEHKVFLHTQKRFLCKLQFTSKCTIIHYSPLKINPKELQFYSIEN